MPQLSQTENKINMDSSKDGLAAALPRLCKALSLLTSPKSSPPSSDQEVHFFNQILKDNLQALSDHVRNSEQLQDDLGRSAGFILDRSCKVFETKNEKLVREEYVNVSLCLLNEITDFSCELAKAPYGKTSETGNNCSAVPKLDPSALSVAHIKTVSTSLQFVIVLGVCPFLSPGVGISVSQRLGAGQVLLATAHDYLTDLSQLSRIQHLLPPVRLLCNMLETPHLRDIVIENHLQDLLPALFQLRFSTKAVQEDIATRPSSSAVDTECSSRLTDVSSATQRAPSSSHTHKTLNKDQPPFPIYPSTSTLPEFCQSAPDKPWTSVIVREHCNRYIDLAIRSSGTQHVLKTLMMLSGDGKANAATVAVKTPAWYRRSVAALLRDVLMVPCGTQQLIVLLVAEMSEGNDWQKCKAVARVISQLPTTPSNIELFHKAILTQLLAVLQSQTNPSSAIILRAVGATILELNNRQPSYVELFCLTPLMAPLLQISSANEKLVACTDDIIVSEPSLTSCITHIHQLFVIGQEPQSPIALKLKRVVFVLLSMLLASKRNISPLKSKCKDLLGVYIGQCDSSQAVSCLLAWLTSKIQLLNWPGFWSLHKDVFLSPGPHGWLQAIKKKDYHEETNLDVWTQNVDVIMDVLSSDAVKTHDLVPHLFITLLQKMTDLVKAECAGEKVEIVLPSSVLTTQQYLERKADLREKVCLMTLIAALGEKYEDQVVSSGSQVLDFVKATLERCIQICQSTSDEVTMTFEWETVAMAMGLLTAVLSGGIDIGDQSNLLDDLLPLLNFISESEAADPRVRKMADDLKVAVATKGLVWAELSKMKSQPSDAKDEMKSGISCKVKKEKDSKKSLIEVLAETNLDEQQDTDDSTKSCKSTLEQALCDLCDPLLPVRGHGLIALARLVDERSPEVQERTGVLLQVFMENLTHTDSYIYLAAVNGLAALADLCPDDVIPRLTSELRAKCLVKRDSNAAGKDSKGPGELVLKLGEAVVKATRRLGEITPKYRDVLLSSILCGCRHYDPVTRSSCLSGLGEVCQLLRFSLGTVIQEVVTCCRDVLSSDSDPHPRKAAALTFTLLIRGLGKDAVQALEDAIIDMYRALKHASSLDSDEGVRTHAKLALDELDVVMREVLFSKPQLSKKITILGYH